MKVSCDEGVASHVGPESCVGGRKIVVEALTGEGAGRVLSLENLTVRSADAVASGGRQHGTRRQRKVRPDSAWSKAPCMHRSISQERHSLSFGSREVPGSAWAVAQVRAVNSQEERRQ